MFCTAKGRTLWVLVCALALVPAAVHGQVEVQGTHVSVDAGEMHRLLTPTPTSVIAARPQPQTGIARVGYVTGGKAHVGVLAGDFRTGVSLDVTELAHPTPITMMSAFTADPIDGVIRAVLAADHNLRELVLTGGDVDLRASFTGTIDYYTEWPRTFSLDLDGDGAIDATYVSADHPQEAALELYERLPGEIDYRHVDHFTGVASPYFHRRGFDCTVNTDWKACAYWQLPNQVPTVEFRPIGGGPARKIALDSKATTSPAAGTVAPIRTIELVTDWFYVGWLANSSRVRGAIVNAATEQVYPYDLGTYGSKGISGLSLFRTEWGPVALWTDNNTFEVRASFATFGGSVFRGTSEPLDELTEDLLLTVAGIEYYLFNQGFVGTRLEGAMFVSGNGLHVLPISVQLPSFKRRAVRH